MSYAVVTLEIESGEQFDLALPLDIPTKVLSAVVAQSLNQPQKNSYIFSVKTDHGTVRIAPSSTLGDAGVLDGFVLQLTREEGGIRTDAMPQKGAYLQAESGEVFALEGGKLTIGRKDIKRGILVDIDLSPLDSNKAISRRHASLERDGNAYYLVDLNSTNGTKLNGHGLISGQKQPLHQGDVIEFGRNVVRLTFHTK